MYQKKAFTLLVVLFFLSQFAFSQHEKPKADSAKIYKNIQQFSQKKKATSFLHRLIFRPINPNLPNKPISKIDYRPYQGKIIRSISITTLDPFGKKTQQFETITPQKELNTVEEWGNKLHIKSKDYTIRKVLLLKENEPLDSLLVKESQRLIRAQRFVNSVAIHMEIVAENPDYVDVFIQVLDSWSLIPNASFSTAETTLKLRERNFLGQGHEIRGEYTNRSKESQNGHLLQYTVNNFRKTFIKLQATHQKEVNSNYNRSLEASRMFVSPLTKWGGGILYEQRFIQDSLADKNGVFAQQRFKFNTDDYWLGHAFSLDNDHSEKSKITNLIVAGRFLNINFLENPSVAYDSVGFYTDQKLLLMSVGINARNFVQERYLFNNGIIEDVPIGKTYSLTTGYQRKNHTGQLYLGTRASFGNYFRWGFFSMNAEWGSFFQHSKTVQSAFSFQANYFTKLFEIGDWKIRQFLKQQVIFGNHRLAATGDQITLNGEYGIPGFNNALYGTKKMVFSAQTQSYSPWDLWGFRLNPFFNYTLGIIGNDKNTKLKNQTYSSIGLGLIINNDYLVFSSFQLSFAYYPTTFGPDDKNLRTNAFETSDFGLLDFELNKPRTVIYK
ncbi:hypothetical protein [Flavobacterium sp.]|jgi:outer membrane protein assembly factor BamA|uniref:hypothetical protein n=1 Tax=Flavobacterium sp. TaxID=239 RepID=UPI0022BDB0B8|nr:hypothetical protein [Flavobacterium sp.]MCZ8228474.1 hypothetical protein [Flavobacterium sp.]